MSLTYEEVGNPIARIIDEKTNSFKLVYINECSTNEPEEKISESYLDEQLSGDEILHLGEALMQGLTLRQFLSSLDGGEDSSSDYEDIGKFIYIKPTETVAVIPKVEPERVLLCGPSGTGKSTQAARYAMEWKLQHPRGEIFLFCISKKDPAYDGIDLIEIKVKQDILQVEMSLEDFTGCLVIFDDMDNLPIAERKYIHRLVNDIFANSRKLGTYTLYLSHVILRGMETKVINNEANKVYLFTGVGDKQNIDFLKTYAGMDTRQARAIATMSSRWLCLNRNRPRYIIHEKGVMLL